MTVTLNLFGKLYTLALSLAQYQNGATALALLDGGEPFATVSVNLPESSSLPRGTFYVKAWSENEALVAQLISQGVLVPAPEVPVAASGFIREIRAYRLARPLS